MEKVNTLIATLADRCVKEISFVSLQQELKPPVFCVWLMSTSRLSVSVMQDR